MYRSKNRAILTASFLQLKPYLLGVAALVGVSIITNLIISLNVDRNTHLSLANMLSLFLLFAASVLPSAFFRRMLNLGASRGEYYRGLVTVYVLCSAGFALLNVLWFAVEVGIIRKVEDTINILEVFHWNRFGWAGMFLYQFGAYLLLLSLLNLLFSGIWHWSGWLLWAVLIAAIPLGTALDVFRPKVAGGLGALLFNDSLMAGLGWTLLGSLLLLAAGWLFTRRRTI
ncbi:hypothetical protein MJA45_26840 [Paenibacillus aurantius]|uniref:Uncharacterized protein n=1 Tax=Paenibacillus aurantius TaxID=2918900 RepID=A0AA96LD70_9BACL|nr:hypothetical protein [Paenibacillus aurantius]WNQ11175.1 hypothetical protein MJA45_26840 [Paenibacillus aurantius]